jgi:UDP-GlcNAc:undecaprenyl-phosphate GlcNAc-1-phosphate transferase
MMTVDWFRLGAAFPLSWLLTRGIEFACHRLELYDQPGSRKMHKVPIPRLGGFSFFLAPLLLAFGVIDQQLPLGIRIGALLVYLGGVYDDFIPANSALVKLFFQIPAALLCAWWLPISSFGFLANDASILVISLRLLAAAYTLFMINAFNLMDNMNGLTGGISFLWLGYLGLLSFFGGMPAASWFFCFLFCLALLGFLIRNFPKGHIYMGDQGSQLLGFLVAASSLLLLPTLVAPESALPKTLFAVFIFSGLFVADVVTVVVIRYRTGKKLWQGDQNHLSHQLVRRGFSPVQTAFILFACQFGLLILGSWPFLIRGLS